MRIGGKNVGYTVGTKGRTASASIPGTGLGITSRKGTGPDINWAKVLAFVALGVLVLVLVGVLTRG